MSWLKQSSKNTIFPLLLEVRDKLFELGLNGFRLTQAELLFEEILVNIASYAYPEKDGEVVLTISKNETHLIVEIVDQGIPFNPLTPLKRSTQDTPGGLGCSLIAFLAEEATYERRGEQNSLRFTFPLLPLK